MEFDKHTYNVAQHYLSAIIDGDYSGLSDGEESHLEAFLALTTKQLPGGVVHHWVCENISDTCFSMCDVSGFYADCVRLSILFPVLKETA
jgi:hypothetical protein